MVKLKYKNRGIYNSCIPSTFHTRQLSSDCGTHMCFLPGELTAFCKWSLALSMGAGKARILSHSQEYQSMTSLDH